MNKIELFFHRLTGEIQSMAGAGLYIGFLLALSAMAGPADAAPLLAMAALPDLWAGDEDGADFAGMIAGEIRADGWAGIEDGIASTEWADNAVWGDTDREGGQ